MKQIINKEHMEAAQQKVDGQRSEVIEALPEEEREKFKAIEKAVRILTDAKILFYLFPYLKRGKDPSLKKSVWQWNSLSELAELDESGKPTKADGEQNVDFHCGVFNWTRILIKNEWGKTFDEDVIFYGEKLINASIRAENADVEGSQ